MKRSELERLVDEADEARKRAVQEWRDFVESHCSFENGTPSRPESLPDAKVAEHIEAMRHWNKEWARLCVQLEKEQSAPANRRTA